MKRRFLLKTMGLFLLWHSWLRADLLNKKEDQKAVTNILKFKDPNFKLAVINILMYEKNILKPALDPFEFAEKYHFREIDVEKEGDEIIPEIMEYFEQLEVQATDVEGIEELYQDGGDDIYMTISPFWSGEDDRYNLNSAEDALLLPKLKKVTLFASELGDVNERLLQEFKSKGIAVYWV